MQVQMRKQEQLRDYVKQSGGLVRRTSLSDCLNFLKEHRVKYGLKGMHILDYLYFFQC